MNNEQSVTQISAYRMDGVCDHKLRILGSNGLFQWEAQIREINKKGSFFRHPRNLKRVKFCMYIFLFVSSACFKCFAYMYLIFNHKLEVKKNTAYIEKFEFDTIILTSQKRVLYLVERKNRVLLKRGLLEHKINDFGCVLCVGCFNAI